MRFLDKAKVAERFQGKSVAIVGSGPGCLGNRHGFVDSHDVVVRVNNYRLSHPTGHRTDVFYSFFGNSIRKEPQHLLREGVKLCMCKCPNAHAIESDWHRENSKEHGVDFRWIYEKRAPWWFCDTYVPSVDDFLATFNLLDGHVPTTGFSAILDVLSFDPKSIFLTGFDFFRSGLHNVNERWIPGNVNDPIRHVPERELSWLAANAKYIPMTCDATLAVAMSRTTRAVA